MLQQFLAQHKIKAQKIAVGVSGGADSLTLVLMAKEQLTVFGYEIVALTVNHNLRPTAAKEAAYVAEIMQAHKIEHHILEWIDTKPKTGIEEAARLARYKLITEWCKQHNVKVLLTAHHLQDQAETFLMRLERGSGLEGLCSMRPISKNNEIIIARPLLNTEPQTLRDYLKQRQIKWVEDESNQNIEYLRNRIRRFLPELNTQTGISSRCLAQTAERLQCAEDYIKQQTAQTFAAQVQSLNHNVFYFKHTDFLRWHREIKFRILAQLCRREYIPRAESILKAVELMEQLPFSGLTLGGKEIFYAYDNIWIVPELHAKRLPSRKAWKEFILQNPLYAAVKIPHKARVAILENAE